MSERVQRHLKATQYPRCERGEHETEHAKRAAQSRSWSRGQSDAAQRGQRSPDQEQSAVQAGHARIPLKPGEQRHPRE